MTDTPVPETNSLQLLAEAQGIDPSSYTRGMPIALLAMLDNALYARFWGLSKMMAGAEGFVPAHLKGKPEACFAVITYALTWRLNPYAVAQATYQTPGGRVGYEGKLIIAILERSGHFEGPIDFEHVGDWSAVLKAKAKVAQSPRGGTYNVPGWDEPAEWVADKPGVRVSALVKGEVERRSLVLYLHQCQPRNSTLWATDPQTQICYTAARRFASLRAPSIIMGVPFEDDGSEGMVEINPEERAPRRPQPGDFTRRGDRSPREPVVGAEVVDLERDRRQGATEPAGASESGAAVEGRDEPERASSDEQAVGNEPSEFGDPALDALRDGWKEALAACSDERAVNDTEKEWVAYKAEAAKMPPDDGRSAYIGAVNALFLERRKGFAMRGARR